MARIRSIHPDALKSERLALATAEGERCYWRLQPHCDDEGRCEDAPKILAAYLFPVRPSVSPADIDRWLEELHQLGLVLRHEDLGVPMLKVTDWGSYQIPRRYLDPALRSAVLARDGLICGICAGLVNPDDVHIDHIHPVAKGGTDVLTNLRVTHSRCNLRKGARAT